ncbi:MAG: ATP-binding protein [Candidatus Aminicenantes bacterium]|nr:ATP-binding protein [Candidatus Aminicenantes bacterium]
MKLKISIYTRLVFWITLLICLLFGAVLFVIQIREARILRDETEARALLQARYMADANLQNLSRQDWQAVQKYVDGHIAGDLIYIVVYDRAGQPAVWNTLVRSHDELASGSLLGDAMTPEETASETKTLVLGGETLRVLEVEAPSFAQAAGRWGSVKIGLSLEPMYARLREIQKVLLLIGVGGFLLGIAGAAFLARRITRPLHRLVDGTVRIANGDFSQAIVNTSRDEVGDLARSFSEMTAQLLQARQRMEEANRCLVQHEKLASIGRMAATIAHEIRNPLTSVKLNIQKVAEEESFAETVKAHLGLSLEGIDQIERFIKELLNFTRVQELLLERWPVGQIVEESLKMIRGTLDQKKIAVEKACAADLPPVLADADKLRQVFLNVLRNAHEALDAGGKITIGCDTVAEGGRTMVRVRIADNGPGIKDKDRPNIFEPFYTTKPSGFGLGLANARKIVEQHNGTIGVGKKRGRGSAFVILIPAEEAK